MKPGKASEMIRKNWGIFFAAVFLSAAAIYVIVRREAIYVTIHDFLDATHVYLTMLKDHGLFWTLKGDVPFLGGVDRNRLPSEFKLYNWLYMVFPAFPALVVGWFLRIAVSIAGFLVLSRFLPEYSAGKRNLAAICGLIYGIFPSFTVEGIGFASLPLLLALFLSIYRKPKPYHYVLLLFYPILSSFVFFGIFICGYLVLFFVIDWIVRKKPAFRMLFSLLPIAAGYILTEWRLFSVMFFSGEASIRGSYETDYIGYASAVRMALSKFVNGEFHCDALQKYFVLPVCLIFFVYINIRYILQHQPKRILTDYYNWIVLWLLGNAFIYPLEYLEGFQSFIKRTIPPLAGFGFSRTLWFNPFLWYFLFFVLLLRIGRAWLRNLLWIGAFTVVCCVPVQYNAIIYNVPGVYGLYCKMTGTEPHLSYGEFYSAELFDRIKKDIGYDGEWSAAYGMHPAVLNYNDISTLDGYFTLYPLSYKEEFREVIAPELAVNESGRDYYDGWGGRAYLFSREISYQPDRTMKQNEADLLIDPDAFRKLGGEYIFSRVLIRNAEALGFSEPAVYSDENSPYTIYVYKMRNGEGS